MVTAGRMILKTKMPTQFTTLKAPLKTGKPGILANPVYSTETKMPVLRSLLENAKKLANKEEISLAAELEIKGIIPKQHADPQNDEHKLYTLHKNIAASLLQINRPEPGSMAFAKAEDYFALTPNTPKVGGENWKKVQVLLHSPEELLKTTKHGIEVMKSNSIDNSISTVAYVFPVAGEASRAQKYAAEHPELVDKISKLQNLSQMGNDSLPPRFLFPISTLKGNKTLYGLMLRNILNTSESLNLMSLVISIFNHKSSNLVIESLKNEGFGNLAKEKLDLLLGSVQSTAPRIFVSDMETTKNTYATGHGEVPYTLAKTNMFQVMKEMGIKYLIFGNADEFLWGSDPTMIGLADKLIKGKGYNGVVFVVPNSNNQPGGGVVRDLLKPTTSFKLCESPCLPSDLSDGKTNPSAINTTFYILSVKALASKAAHFLNLAPGLDIKTSNERGRNEQVGCLETWAGTEFTKNLNCAFVMAPRAGFFLGIKTLEHTHSDNIPPEIKDFPNHRFSNWSYEKLVKYLANSQPTLIQKLINGDKTAAYEIWRNGYSYLADPIITGINE